MISQSIKNQRVVNLVQLILSIWLFCFAIVSTIIGSYAHISTSHYSSINHSFTQYQVSVIDYGSGADLLITAGVIQAFVAILGIVGSFIGMMDGLQRIGIGFMIAYGVLLLVTSGLNLASAITAYGGYDDFESGAIELLRRLYLDQIGNSIKMGEPKEVLNRYQLSLKCCGVWSYTDYVTSSNLQDSSISLTLDALTSDSLVLPNSCCPSTVSDCTALNAYKIGCMPKMQQVIYQACTDGATGLNCIFTSLVEVDSKLFAVFIIGLVQTLVSMMFFVGTVLQIIYSVNFFRTYLSEHNFPQSGERYYSEQPRGSSPPPINTPELI